jgi:uncharacterized protein with HEPN domain
MDRDTASILDIPESARTIMAYVAGMTRQDFLRDTQVQDSVIRRLEIIGEAAGRISPGFRGAQPEIHWSEIRGMRNRMMHGYDDVDMDIVWDTVERDIPHPIQIIESLSPPEGE